MSAIVRFLWHAAGGRGFRFAPSPYVRWRIETYTGKKAEDVRSADVLHLAWTERRQFVRFLGWIRTMDRYARVPRNLH